MYVDARGVRTYYDEVGTGDPVVLLHGGGGGSDSWLAQRPALAERYRVLIPERRGHGRSPEVARAIPDAQVAVVPGTSHGLPLEKPGLVNGLLLDFLADPQPPKFMPMGDLNT
ncbi:alpha/beta fold hydrolase [Kribbella sp. NPDC026596]|uniref:alpha/beta fold hydrolase n=1 Tax=Kribbella sp. NPDC026596 TaxID=3155122 RepID=UPI0033FACC06